MILHKNQNENIANSDIDLLDHIYLHISMALFGLTSNLSHQGKKFDQNGKCSERST